jgi:hypothetical protein
VIAPPIQFDRTTGVLEDANVWERLAALALSSGSKVAASFSHRRFCANLLRKTLPQRDIAIRLNPDATFDFPYGDGYWSKLLNRQRVLAKPHQRPERKCRAPHAMRD